MEQQEIEEMKQKETDQQVLQRLTIALSRLRTRGFKEKVFHGWFAPEEGDYYNEMASAIHDSTIIEIGVFDGLSMSYIVETCTKNNNKIIGIDLEFRSSALWLQKQYPKMITLLKTSSEAACQQFKELSVDLIFIDGSHVYQYVENDIKCWRKKLKFGHWMFGHDYGDRVPDVKKAVQVNLPDHIYIPTYCGLWAWHKHSPITFI